MELFLVMSCLCKGSFESSPICNGFKDVEYVELALIARKLSLNTVIVLEQEEELDSVLDLRTKHSGHFGATSGEKGNFGLITTQIARAVRKIEQCGMLDCFELFHFHIGSQIPTTELLADGVGEAAQIYCELSGRALVSHHSVLIFEAVSSSKYTVPTMSSFDVQGFVEQLPEDAHSDYNNLSQSAVRGDYEAGLAYGYVSRTRNERVGSGDMGVIIYF
ncbi:putative arginine decarboxylase [Helianthus anomalus]